MRRALLLPSLLLAGCAAIPGTEAGGPCNAQGVCVEGLACDIESNTCVAPEEIAWEKMRTPAATTLVAVWGFNENDLFAVGGSGTVFRYKGNDLDWEEDTTAKAMAGEHSFSDISGRGSELWAVGSGVALSYQGSWSKQVVMDTTVAPAKALTSYTFNAVSASVGGPVLAVGYTSYSKNYVFSLKGSEWSTDASLPYSPEDLAVIGEQVFVVGEAQQVRHFDGQGWVTKNLDKVLALKGAWGRTADDVWAVGPSETLAHFDGSTWSITAAKNLPAVAAVAGTAEGDFYLVGASGGYYNNYTGVHHCSATGTCVPAPLSPDKTSKAFKGVWCSDDGKTVVVVGESGTVYRRRR